MPSFDIVSKIDQHELSNAVDQANREVQNRFDFKGTDAEFIIEGEKIILSAPSDFQLKQLKDILDGKVVKRGIDVRSLDYKDPELALNVAKQTVELQMGLNQESAKKVVKLIKDEKFKVQAQIQGDQVRVTGKKRDDLQAVMTLLRGDKINLPLQFDNFRD